MLSVETCRAVKHFMSDVDSLLHLGPEEDSLVLGRQSYARHLEVEVHEQVQPSEAALHHQAAELSNRSQHKEERCRELGQ